ncbi:MAG: tetratricopeptide repeat protein [Elusimicrobiota bacterium]
MKIIRLGYVFFVLIVFNTQNPGVINAENKVKIIFKLADPVETALNEMLSQKQYAKLIEYCNQNINITKSRKKKGVLLSALGDMYCTIEKYDLAIERYARAVEFDDKNCVYWEKLGLAYYSAGLPEDANKWLTRTVKSQKKNGNANFMLGKILLEGQRYEDALVYLIHATELLNTCDAYALLGEAYSLTGDHPRSITALRKAISLDSNLKYKYSLAQCYYHNREYDKSNEILSMVIASTPSAAGIEEAYFRRGLIAYKNNFFGNACADFKKVLELKPASTAARLMLALTYYRTADYDTAVSLARELSKGSASTWIKQYATMVIERIEGK